MIILLLVEVAAYWHPIYFFFFSSDVRGLYLFSSTFILTHQ